ncbi:hypothetical protein IKR20_08830 [bacterium]|nr:hypothetical protein [bacterium]
MKKTLLLLTAILCSMLFASCSATRTYAPYAFSTVSTVTLPALQHSLERKDYEILDTISRDAVVIATSQRGYVEIKAETGEFVNICNQSEAGLMYDVAASEGTLRYGFIDGLRLDEPNECDGTSMAALLAAYRLINEVKTIHADGIVAPSLYVTAEETDKSFFSRTVTYKVVISAKLIKLNTK